MSVDKKRNAKPKDAIGSPPSLDTLVDYIEIGGDMNEAHVNDSALPEQRRRSSDPAAFYGANWEELRSIPGFMDHLLVLAVICRDFGHLPDTIPSRSDPSMSFLSALDENFFKSLEIVGKITWDQRRRDQLGDIIYGWAALERTKCSVVFKHSRGAPRKWGANWLIALLEYVYEHAGGTVSLSWTTDGLVASPYSDYLRAIWGFLPADLTGRTSSDAFVRRARSEHIFNRRFKDDLEHSQWLSQQEAKKKKRPPFKRRLKRL